MQTPQGLKLIQNEQFLPIYEKLRIKFTLLIFYWQGLRLFLFDPSIFIVIFSEAKIILTIQK